MDLRPWLVSNNVSLESSLSSAKTNRAEGAFAYEPVQTEKVQPETMKRLGTDCSEGLRSEFRATGTRRLKRHLIFSVVTFSGHSVRLLSNRIVEYWRNSGNVPFPLLYTLSTEHVKALKGFAKKSAAFFIRLVWGKEHQKTTWEECFPEAVGEPFSRSSISM